MSITGTYGIGTWSTLKSVWCRENVKRCLSPAIITLSHHSHLQYLRIPSSSVNIPCTVEHKTSSFSAITDGGSSVHDNHVLSQILNGTSCDCRLAAPGIVLSWFSFSPKTWVPFINKSWTALIIFSCWFNHSRYFCRWFFRTTKNFFTLHNSMPPFGLMIFSVTTITAREQKHYSFRLEEQIVLKISGNDRDIKLSLDVSALVWHWANSWKLDLSFQEQVGKNGIFRAALGTQNGVAMATHISGFLDRFCFIFYKYFEDK